MAAIALAALAALVTTRGIWLASEQRSLMEIVLIAAMVVVAAAALYVALTFSRRTRQTTAPLIDEAVSALREQLTGELGGPAAPAPRHRRRTAPGPGRATAGRTGSPGPARSRRQPDPSMSRRLLAELDVIKRHGEQIGDQAGELTGNLQRLAAHARRGARAARAAVPGRLYVERLQFSVIRAPVPAPYRRRGRHRGRADRGRPAARSAARRALGDPPHRHRPGGQDPGFRDRLGEAASDYAASRLG